MLLGLLGPSCCGKSFYLKVLQENLDFYVPVGITTRPARIEENGKLEHIDELEFSERQRRNELCFIAEVSGYRYAYPIVDPNVRNIAIEIRRENIPELKAYYGFVMKIVPEKLEEGINRILLKRKQGTLERKEELIKEFETLENDSFDLIFRNNYDNESRLTFLNTVKKMSQKGV